MGMAQILLAIVIVGLPIALTAVVIVRLRQRSKNCVLRIALR